MNGDPISALAAIAGSQAVGASAGAMSMQSMPPAGMANAAIASGDTFGQMVSSGIEGVNKELLASQTDLQELAVGNAQNLHQIMMRMEESRLSFQLLMQVRSRLLEAYQDVMKMQV